MISLSDLISSSWRRTEIILLETFSFKKIFLFILIAMLAGHSGGSFKTSRQWNKSYKNTVKSQTAAKNQPTSAAPKEETDSASAQEKQKIKDFITSPKLNMIMAVLFLFILSLLIFFNWLHSKFEFVWQNAVLNNSTEIKLPLSEYAKESGSLFLIRLILMSISVCLFLGLYFKIIPPFIELAHSDGLTKAAGIQILKSNGWFFLIYGLASFILGIASFGVNQLLVPIMMIRRTSCREAFSACSSLIQKDYFSVVWFMIQVFLACCLIGFIMGFALVILYILTGCLFLVFKWVAIPKILFGLLGFIAGLVFLGIVLFMGLIQTVMVTHFGYYFLSGFNSDFLPVDLSNF